MSTLRKRDHVLLVQLADGTLSGRARADAEARLRAIPDGDRLIARQRRVARALGGGTARAPAREPVRVGGGFGWRVAMGGALATVLLLVWVFAPGRSTTEQAADMAQRSATQPAPATSGETLRAEVDGLSFPDWGPEFGWHATGMRRDEIDGRPTATVFYEHMGHRLAYTIVSGSALPRPGNARVVERDGVEIALYRDAAHGGHDIAVFERDGRTCVVAGHVLRVETLLKLAAWKGDDQLRS